MNTKSSSADAEFSKITLNQDKSLGFEDERIKDFNQKRIPAFLRHLWAIVSDPNTDVFIKWNNSNDPKQTFTICIFRLLFPLLFTL